MRNDGRLRFILRWVVSTLMGLFAGCASIVVLILLYSKVVERLNLPTNTVFQDEGVWLISIVVAFVISASVGFVQSETRLPFMPSRLVWVLASGVSGIAVWGAFLIVNENTSPLVQFGASQYSGLQQSNVISDTWFLTVLIISLLFGTALSFPKWFILRRKSNQAGLLIIGNIVSIFVILCLFLFLTASSSNDMLPTWSSYCTSPFIFSAVTGVTMYRILNKPKEVELSSDHAGQ